MKVDPSQDVLLQLLCCMKADRALCVSCACQLLAVEGRPLCVSFPTKSTWHGSGQHHDVFLILLLFSVVICRALCLWSDCAEHGGLVCGHLSIPTPGGMAVGRTLDVSWLYF